MPAVYEYHGLRFLYPEGWTLEEGEDSAIEGLSVAVSSPAGAFWSVTRHASRVDPQALAARALAALKEEYPEADAEPARQELAGHTVGGYDLQFFYLDLVCSAAIRVVRTPAASYVILAQAEDREYEQLARVFDAITASLLGQGAPE